MRQQRWRNDAFWNDSERNRRLAAGFSRLPRPASAVAGLRGLMLLICLGPYWLGAASAAQAQAVRDNPGFRANSIPANDDGSTSTAMELGFSVNFFGETFNAAFVNNNGNITFGGPLSTFTPEGLVASPLRIIAPFWADVDTRAPGSSLVTYGRDVVNGRPAFGANWVNVGYFASHADKLNSFQLVLIDRSDIAPGDFDIEFNYDRIEWETGDASGGSGGLGGTSASAGYSNGSGTAESSFEILGSRVNGVFLDSNRNGLRYRRLNSTQRGRLVFFVRSGSVGCTYGVLSLQLDFPWEGGSGALQVAAPFDCTWQLTSSAGFVNITTTPAGRGSQVIEFTVAENRTPFRRTATLTVAGESVVITQEAFITLSMTPPAVTLSPVSGSFPSRVAMQLDAISGEVDWFASVSLLSGSGWNFHLTPSSGHAKAGTPETLILELNSGFLPPTSATAVITVVDLTNGPSLSVPLTIDVSPAGNRLLLSQTAFVFRSLEGGSLPPPQSLTLANAGAGALSWSLDTSALASSPWLSFSSTAGAIVPGAASPSSTVLSVNPAGLAPGVYQALVPVNASGSANDRQAISVTLQVVAASSAPAPAATPAGLLFVQEPGGSATASQNLFLSNQGGGSLSFELQTVTDAGGNWLQVSTSSGSVASLAAAVSVSVSPAGLQAGIYHGRIFARFTGDSIDTTQTVEVVLVVVPRGGQTLFGGAVCQPTGLTLLSATVGGGARLAAAFPAPLTARLVDSCGRPVNHATVLVHIEGLVIPLPSAGNGYYRGEWTPEQPVSSTTVKFVALHPVFGNLERSVTVSVEAAPADAVLPLISSNGVVDAAGFAGQRPLAPGGIVSIFGSNFSTDEFFATGIPLERELGGVSVRIGEQTMPLFYVGPFQINAQVPFTVAQGSRLPVIVTANGRQSAPQEYLIGAVLPGIFQSQGSAAALDGQSRPITASNPARIGGVLQLFATGLGLTNPEAGTGEAAPASSTVRDRVEVFIGGVEVPVTFQGLAPGFVGLYQVNVVLPATLTPGNDVPVVLRQNGMASNVVSIPLSLP